MSFEPENPLEEALMRANRNPMSRREFHRLLIESDLIVIGRIEGREDSPAPTPLMPGEKLQVASFQENGRRYVPVFTSMTRLQAYLEKTAGYVTLNGRTLLEATRGATLLVNLRAEFGRELTPEEIDALLDPKTLH
jgi:hypothetical protein